jgi:U3 small nucleolar RNA-associated protein MPP10
MDDDQVWGQLELRTGALCDALRVVLEEEVPDDSDAGGLVDSEMDGLEEFEDLHGMDDMEDINEEDYGGQDSEDDEGDEDEEGEDEEGDDDDDNGEDSDDLGEDIAGLRDPSDDSGESDEEAMDLDKPLRTATGTKKGKQRAGHPELDDAFFSLADFNSEIEEAEAKSVSKGRLRHNEDDGDDEAEDDIDLFDTVDDLGVETFEEEDLEGGEYLCLMHYCAYDLMYFQSRTIRISLHLHPGKV